ncbi:DUF1574 domain-containing protein [Candidatus Parcubacteria bacterium]|nr:MAG: DUF1574 domain-containing protein [Candidatus Parcubacteria bacterium]
MIEYRPEIDGLRAVAVVSVILFHMGIKLFSGGYVGVDVFFVISGYLITSIIYKEIIGQRFSLIEFYERRARRILPALLLITSISIILAWFFLTPAALSKFSKSVIGVATFSSNIVFWLQLQHGYFEESTRYIPLIHTWSLGVEEQFYLLFPLLMILLAKLRYSSLHVILFVFVVGSLCLSIWAVDYQNHQSIVSGAFFLLPTRAWELGIGGLIAIHKKQNLTRYSANWINNSLALLGMILIIFSMLILDQNSLFPGISAIAPVIGTGLIIFCSNEKTWIGRILSIKPMVLVGLASYSLYLWHQILIAYWYNAHQTDLNTSSIVALILASSILSFLSFRFVEKPFRNRKFLGRKTILLMSVISLAGIGAIGYSTNLATQNYEDFLALKLSKAKYIYFQNMDERKFVCSRLKYNLPEADAIIMGSSRAMQIGSHTLGHPVLNLSVSGASVEDYIAFVPEAIKKVNASLVFLGADPWLFNSVSGQTRWKSVKDLYGYWSRVISQGESLRVARRYLITKGSERGALSWLETLYKAVNRSAITTENGDMENIAKKRYDGFHIYDKLYAGKSQSDIERGFDRLLNYSMESYVDDDINRQKYISLIHFLKENGVRVVIVLSPYHPDLFQRIKREKPEFLTIENEFRKIAANLNIPIIGSYDPALVGCDATEFYDGMHPKESCMKKVLK